MHYYNNLQCYFTLQYQDAQIILLYLHILSIFQTADATHTRMSGKAYQTLPVNLCIMISYICVLWYRTYNRNKVCWWIDNHLSALLIHDSQTISDSAHHIFTIVTRHRLWSTTRYDLSFFLSFSLYRKKREREREREKKKGNASHL